MAISAKQGCVIATLILAALLGLPLLAFEIYHLLHPICHQRTYRWDQYVLPVMKFRDQPWTKVAADVNAAIAAKSKGAVTQAIIIDTTPTQITKVNCGEAINAEADALIADYRRHEQKLFEQGACGFETTPCGSLTVGGGHSIGCPLMMAVPASDLLYEEKPDAIHISRSPKSLECHPYAITDALQTLMEKRRAAHQLHVDAEPIVSALIYATGISSWSFMQPEGLDRHGSETCFDKVFRYLPNEKIILALATPAEHAKAEERLKALSTTQPSN